MSTVKLSKAAVDRVFSRRMMAVYYAHGRNDAGGDVYVDAEAFGLLYAGMWRDVETGAAAHCSSVQDAFGFFLTTVTP